MQSCVRKREYSCNLCSFLLYFSVCLTFCIQEGTSFPLQVSRRSLLLSTVSTASFPPHTASTTTTMASSLASTTTSSNNSTTNSNTIPRNIHWGIVGLGDVTEKKSGPPFYKCQGCQLVAVMRRTPGKAAEWAQQRVPADQGCVGYDNLDQFLAHPGLDAVYVATRPGTHLEICRRVAAAGKIIYVEKPVGRCAAETQAIADLTAVSGKPVYTAYISRAYKRTQTVRQLLSEGVIGDCVTAIKYRLVGKGGARGMDTTTDLPWRLIASQAGGGLIMDVGCHTVDRIDYLCGPLENVTGQAQNLNSPQQKVEDYVELRATIGDSDWAAIPSQGAKVDCVWDFSGRTDQEKDELLIQGPKGALKMVGGSPFLPISVLDTNGQVVDEKTFSAPEHTAQELVQAVTNDICGVGMADFVSRTGNAVRTAQVLDTVLKEYYGSREMGYWEKEEEWPGRPRSSG